MKPGAVTSLLCVLMLGGSLAGVARAADVAPAAATPAPEAPTLDLAAHRGEVVYVDFWASWCGPCRKSFPWLANLQEADRKRGLVVLTVNVDRERKAADRFLNEVGVQLPVVYDPQGKLAGTYKLEGMPSCFIYDRAGKLRVTHDGFVPGGTETELEPQIEALLSEKGPDAK